MKKTVFITGASSGMGRECAKLLSESGFIVYAATRDTKSMQNIKSKTLIPLEVDIKNTDSINKAVQSVIKQQQKIDILINNAGYGLVASVEEVTDEEMLLQFEVNLFSTLRACRAAIPFMRKNNFGVIINISSFLGKIGLPLLTLYNSSKYAMEGITDSLRYELKDFNIRVHSVMPGFFDTKFARENLVTNKKTFDKNSPYKDLVSTLAPTIVDQINSGNDAKDVADMVLKIINDKNFPPRATIGDKAKKFIPMRKELSDEDFERRVMEYYNI